jgi:hypothetical protein
MELREKVMAQYDETSAEVVFSSRPEGAQMFGGKWYVPKWGCDQLEHILDTLAFFDEERREKVGVTEWGDAMQKIDEFECRAEAAESRCAKLGEALEECKRLVDCGEWNDVPAVADAALAAAGEVPK